MTNLTASQIAAQAAMQHKSSSQAQHIRKRSQTVPSPQFPPEKTGGRPKPPPLQITQDNSRRPSGNGHYHNGLVGGPSAAAATAANAAFPRSPQLSPGLTTFTQSVEKEHKLRSEKSKMKLFSKPKAIVLSSHKDTDRKDKPLASPNKVTSPGPSTLSHTFNASTTSLIDPMGSSVSSIYATSNASTSTLVPTDRQRTEEKEKAHRHHFLSRQKNKLKDKIDDHGLALSSAASNSKPDPNAQQSIYSFAPPSPGPSATSFAKSMSGLDLRHGGRALREKKKEEKASAAIPPLESRRPDTDRTDWMPSTSLGSTTGHSFLGPPSTSGASIFNGALPSHNVDYLTQGNLQGFGLTNMAPEDAWDFLKAKLLVIFEGEEVKVPVEDLNRLVSVHIQRCVQKRTPTIITEDLREMLQTGFLSLNQALRVVSNDGLVPHLVETWIKVFGAILPYIQAVFLPLDLEFRGVGTIMNLREAAEFWGATPDAIDDAFANELDVRRIVLVSFRDHVILPKHDALKATFSRLSLDSLNAGAEMVRDSLDQKSNVRPGTAGSLDPALASFNSQGSTLLDDSLSARSRAASNTSAPELPSFAPPPARNAAPPDSSQVTEIVGRMLQCVSVLASVQSNDDAQAKMERLAKELKHNWLGRGRTGRNRRGFVGTRIRSVRRESSQSGTEKANDSRRASML